MPASLHPGRTMLRQAKNVCFDTALVAIAAVAWCISCYPNRRGGLMQVAVLERPGRLVRAERETPLAGAAEVLVRVRAVGICGSDVHYFRHGRIGRYVVE